MVIDDVVLDEKIRVLEQQRDQHLAIYNQANGAIALCLNLKQELQAKDHLTTEELGQALGGKVEAIEPVKDLA